MRILITGHTGFKGTWLSIWLHRLGHELGGIALAPEELSLYNLTNLTQKMSCEYFSDISNPNSLIEIDQNFAPEVIIHLAAQPLVLESYKKPRFTVETNVMGTYNVLEQFSKSQSVQCVLVITTDKVYKDLNSNHPYSELDQLGGKDIYSASKAMADLLVQSWIASFNGPPISLARAGNVIGGGDFSSNRLIPDIYRSLVTNKTIKLRNPSSIRPWQHVLDCLSGYLMAVDKALTTKSPQIWYFGPSQDSKKSVQDLVEAFLGEKRIQVKIDYETLDISETEQINLDVSKANKELGWRNVLDFKDTVDLVSDWYFQFLQGKNSLTMIENQIEYFENLLIKQNMVRTHI